MDAATKGLLDRSEIVDLLNRYAFSLDDKDWKRLATCFVGDAVADYGSQIGRYEGYPAIEQFLRKALKPISTQHVIANHEVTLDGDEASTRCYLIAQHIREGCPGGANCLVGATYRDHVVKTPGGWRIRHRRMKLLWTEGNPAVIEV